MGYTVQSTNISGCEMASRKEGQPNNGINQETASRTTLWCSTAGTGRGYAWGGVVCA